jgi:hypothetical protein
MSKFLIRKAEKKRRRLRLALIGISKSGKTFSALKFARALAGPSGVIGVIDTEGGNSEIYQGHPDVGDFLVITPDEFNPETYIGAMSALINEAHADVVVMDSLSHAWMGRGGVLEIVDAVQGNKFTSGWSRATPLHNDLISAINHCPVHVIATMRQKADYVMTEGKGGKPEPKKVGMAAVQREGMEYEFDITGLMSDNGTLTIDGVRGTDMEAWVGKSIKKPGADFVEKIRELLDTTKAPPPPAPEPVIVGDPEALANQIMEAFAAAGFPVDLGEKLLAQALTGKRLAQPTSDFADAMIAAINGGKYDAKKPKPVEAVIDTADIDAALGGGQ